MEKRVIAVFCAMILMFSGMYYRIFSLSEGEGMAQVAKNQSTYTLEVAKTRAMIYDCNLSPLVNTEKEYRAAILPSPQSVPAMKKLIPDKEQFLKTLEDQKPVLLQLSTDEFYGKGVNLFQVPLRYAKHQPAVHIIGHLREGEGVYGIEQAYNGFLTANGGRIEVRYPIDATGRALSGETPEVIDTTTEPKQGLVLTLDERIQRIAEQAAKRYISKGAVVVMDCKTGDIKASVSLPTFDPNNVARSFEAKDTPFVNKAFAPFNVGSSFKLVVTAAALENGIKPGAFECTGKIDIDGQIFKCNNHAGHGWVDLTRALEVSCNPYFIHLAQSVGAENLRNTAVKFGFGRANLLAEGYESAAGNLPSPDELRNPADVANFGFGQGVLMATPVQLARMVSVFANGGYLITPQLVEGYSDPTGTSVQNYAPEYAANRIISEQTVRKVHDLMVSVVEEGSGKKAKPESGGAGGKTASAQTGQYYDEEKTNEIVEAWFVGFFPAEQPRYTIVVLAQGMDSGSTYAAPIFKDIADGILKLEK
ncbi:penicillin-binding transpeptidase domain-containing protein [Hydrogenoanaerobacterium sp.]|uniref:peptidoglycan D,D-transpeptidase FtsI family protein n=1 Tax=Hydrogenoanaerobacterium sp. TaxID=2953763 RepID=UPI002899B023|nr:penicillin-binding transpeptidase domain-containing protein [Hydrogenoanaerobacterium sp.]